MAARKFSRALLIASEVEPCREFWPNNRDGRAEVASALVLEPSSGVEGFVSFGFRAFPEHLDAVVSATGARENRPAIFHHRDAALEDMEVECASQVVRDFLDLESVSLAEVALVLPPQRPGRLASRLADVLRLPHEKVVQIGAQRDYFTSSLAYSFRKMRQDGRVAAGTPILLIEVAAGLQIWCALYYA
jgi:3-oxoacyl-[acyl-carrier-protein] synthase III